MARSRDPLEAQPEGHPVTPLPGGPGSTVRATVRATSREGARRAAPIAPRARIARLVEPRPDGLPNALVVWSFPGVLVLAVVVLTALDLNGSSTGVLWSLLHRGSDPDVLLGRPRPIRSDEWLVQSSWVVSQVTQGFPVRNTVFPGGMDATLMNDLPTWDWSGLFRPHTWGFLALGLDRGMAIRWWLPAALMVAAAYFFVVTLLPRRPLVAAALALAVVFQPAVQWWWLPIVPNPIAFAFTAMAALVWGCRSRTRWGRVLPAAAAGYLAVDMAMGIYVPFMIPALLATAAFGAGFVLRERRTHQLSWAGVIRGTLPLALAAVGAIAVLVTWLATRRDAVAATLGTVYPGHRVTPPGAGGTADLLGLVSAPFQRSLQFDDVTALGPNQSEASSALLVSLYLLVPLLWVTWTSWRRHRQVDWTILSVIAVQALVLAWLYLPGWDTLASLTGLDRAVPQRLRLIFVVLAVVSVALLLDRLDTLEVRAPWLASGATGAVVVALGGWTWHRLATLDSPVVPSTSTVVVLVVVTVGAVALTRGHGLVGAALLLVGAVVLGIGVNPLNRGVFDLHIETTSGRAVTRLRAADPQARWVGVGSYLAMATLVEAGVPAYSGVQTYPAQPMWTQIDPAHDSEPAWNRLAHVYWSAGSGDPAPHQPDSGAGDQVFLTFDSCARFAQHYVTFVLDDGAAIHQPCLEQVQRFRMGKDHQWIYRVVPPPS